MNAESVDPVNSIMSITNTIGVETAASPDTLTWALGIATYNRADVLLDCLELAANQTRAPAEIIVVDASSDWQVTRERVMQDLAPRFMNIRWQYEKARIASAAAQRNQCLDMSDSDVVFLFDDDSLMYRDCAEHLMRMYELDTREQVVGAAASLTQLPPPESVLADDVKVVEAQRAAPTVARRRQWQERLRQWLGVNELFVPYEPGTKAKELPAELQGRGYGMRDLMAGMTMTVRRSYAIKERFDEIICDRGPEDSDISLRLLRNGPIATVFEARIFHVGSPAGRFSRFSREATDRMGPVVLHRINCHDVRASRLANRRLLCRRLVIGLIKDIRKMQLTFPCTRGALLALQYLDQIYAMTPEQVRAWYPRMQKSLRETGKPVRN